MRRALGMALALLALGETARPAHGAPLSVTIAKVVEDVSIRLGEGEWEDAREGQTVVEGHEIHTGPGSEATIAFSDGSGVVVRELSQLRLNTLFAKGNRLRMEMLLKIGELKAQVKPQQTVSTDFSIGTPTATASVRGTEINRVSYYPPVGMETSLLSGKLVVESARGIAQSGAGEDTKVLSSGEVQTPSDLTQDTARVHVQPVGLTSSEVDQIDVQNQPQITVPSGSQDAADVAGSQGGTLILRVVRN